MRGHTLAVRYDIINNDSNENDNKNNEMTSVLNFSDSLTAIKRKPIELIKLPSPDALAQIHSNESLFKYLKLLHIQLSYSKNNNENQEIISLYNTLVQGLINLTLNQPIDQNKLKQIVVDFMSQQKVTEFLARASSLPEVKFLNEFEISLLQSLGITLRPHQLDLYNLDLEIKRIETLSIDKSNSKQVEIRNNLINTAKKVREEIYTDLNSRDRWHKSFEEMDLENTFGFLDKKEYGRTRASVQGSLAAQTARETAAMLEKITFKSDAKTKEKEINIVNGYRLKQLEKHTPGSNFFTAVSALATATMAAIAAGTFGLVIGFYATLVLAPVYGFTFAVKAAKIARDRVKQNAGLQPTDSLKDFLFFKPRRYTAASIELAETMKQQINIKA